MKKNACPASVIAECMKRAHLIYEPRRENTGIRGFLGLAQTDLYSHRKRLEA